MMRRAIELGEVARLADIVTLVRRTGALEAARQVARDEAAKARGCLNGLPPSTQRDALLELCARSVDRSS